MAVIISMSKVNQAANTVRYRTEITVPGEPYAAKNGKERWSLIVKTGLFEFSVTSGELSFLPNDTDLVFLESEAHQMRCLRKMLECKRSGVFPDHVAWES